MNPPKILIYGYGNPGRQDDGLGIKLSEEIEAWVKSKDLYNVEFDSGYQLNIEDATVINNKDFVIFVDASHENIDDFLFTEVIPDCSVNFSTHSVSPSYILHICMGMYQTVPKTYLLHIKGYEWNFLSDITTNALQNLYKAEEYVKQFILSKSLLLDKKR